MAVISIKARRRPAAGFRRNLQSGQVGAWVVDIVALVTGAWDPDGLILRPWDLIYQV